MEVGGKDDKDKGRIKEDKNDECRTTIEVDEQSGETEVEEQVSGTGREGMINSVLESFTGLFGMNSKPQSSHPPQQRSWYQDHTAVNRMNRPRMNHSTTRMNGPRRFMSPHSPRMLALHRGYPQGAPKPLMTVYPATLLFNIFEDDHDLLLTSTSEGCISFRVDGSAASLWNCYNVTPSHGVIMPSDYQIINFALKDDITHKQLMEYSENQAFKVKAMTWPSVHKAYSEEIWNKRLKINVGYMCKDIGIMIGTYTIDAEDPDKAKLLIADPLVLTFKPPFGKDSQTCSATLCCIVSNPVAFKVQVQTTRIQFYYVTPKRGILKPGESVKINVEMNKSFTIDKSKPPHLFHISAFSWASDKQEFDLEIWKQLEETKMQERQVIELKAQFADDKTKLKKVVSKKETKKGKKCSVKVYPCQLSYKPPYGKKKQNCKATIQSTSSDTVAFKITSNMIQYYVVKPGKGILQPGQETQIKFTLRKTFDGSEMNKPKRHRFLVLAVPWPKKHKDFDAKTWEIQESNSEQLQTTTMAVAFGL